MRARDLNVIIVRWNETTAQIRLGNGWTTDYANYLRIPDRLVRVICGLSLVYDSDASCPSRENLCT